MLKGPNADKYLEEKQAAEPQTAGENQQNPPQTPEICTTSTQQHRKWGPERKHIAKFGQNVAKCFQVSSVTNNPVAAQNFTDAKTCFGTPTPHPSPQTDILKQISVDRTLNRKRFNVAPSGRKSEPLSCNQADKADFTRDTLQLWPWRKRARSRPVPAAGEGLLEQQRRALCEPLDAARRQKGGEKTHPCFLPFRKHPIRASPQKQPL